MKMIIASKHICQYKTKDVTNYPKTILSQVFGPLFSLAKLEEVISNKIHFFNDITVTNKSSVKKLRVIYLSFFCLRIK